MANAECLFDECERPKHCKGYCSTHYQQFLKSGRDHHALKPIRTRSSSYSEDEVCQWEDCNLKPVTRDMCSKHYQRTLKHDNSDVESRVLLLEGEPEYEQLVAVNSQVAEARASAGLWRQRVIALEAELAEARQNVSEWEKYCTTLERSKAPILEAAVQRYGVSQIQGGDTYCQRHEACEGGRCRKHYELWVAFNNGI